MICVGNGMCLFDEDIQAPGLNRLMEIYIGHQHVQVPKMEESSPR